MHQIGSALAARLTAWRALLPALVVTLVSVLGAAPALAEPATAEPFATENAPAEAQKPDEQSNGCGLGTRVNIVPEKKEGVFDFTDACAKHDKCYVEKKKTQEECDADFLRDMYESCKAMHGDKAAALKTCQTIAQVYYRSVRAGGFFIYEQYDEAVMAVVNDLKKEIKYGFKDATDKAKEGFKKIEEEIKKILKL